MKKLLCVFALFVAVQVMFTPRAFAAGFALPEQSASALGMASAFVGQADDASAVWYNPATLTQLDGTRIMGGSILIYPEFTHETTTGTTDASKRTFHSPIHLYATHKMNDWSAFGLGVNNPFGLGTNWDNASATSTTATLTLLKTTEVNPNIAFKIADKLSVAVGVAYVYVEATMASMLGGQEVRIKGHGGDWGGNVAIHYRPADQLHLGLSYRSRVKVDLHGRASLGATSNPATTSLTLPDLFSFGMSYKPTERLTLNADIGYTWWSTYDELVIYSATFGGSLIQQKQWTDVWNLRVGGQYKLNDQWKLRMGYVYDQNPVLNQHFETRVPDSDRHGFSVGAGYMVGNLTIDAGYLYLLFETRNVADRTSSSNLNGKYRNEAHVAGVSMGYKF